MKIETEKERRAERLGKIMGASGVLVVAVVAYVIVDTMIDHLLNLKIDAVAEACSRMPLP